jgi:hypothetical protein
MSVPADIRKVVTVEADSYSWRQNSRIKADAAKAVTELRGIYTRDGAVTPSAVVEAAKPKGALLHDEFEWNNSEAGRLYREDQARHLMRSLVIVYKKADGSKTEPIRAFVKLVPSADDPMIDEAEADVLAPHVYVPVRTVVDEHAHRRRWKIQALSALQSWRRQYRDISEFAAIFEAIDALAAREDVAS